MEFLVRLILFLIPGKRLRKKARLPVRNFVFGAPVRRKALRVGKGLRVRGNTTVTKKTSIGDSVSLGGVKIHGGGACTIGNYVHFGPDVLVLTQNHDYESTLLPYDHRLVFKDVVVEDAAWIGMRVTILPGTKIGEGAIIQAGSVVHGEIPPCAIAGGNPAKVFAWRDKEHYEKLKAAGAYYRKGRED